MTKHRTPLPVVAQERSGPFTVTLTDGSYIQWDKNDGLFRVAFYARKAAKGHDLRTTISLVTKKPTYGPLVDIIMKFIEERPEYADAISAEKMVQ